MQDNNQFSDRAISNLKTLIAGQNDEMMRLKQAVDSMPVPIGGPSGCTQILYKSADECLNLALQYGKHLTPIKEEICLLVDEIWDLRKEGKCDGQWAAKRIERLKIAYRHKYLVLRTIHKVMAPLLQQAAQNLDLFSLEAEINGGQDAKSAGWSPSVAGVNELLEALAARTKDFQFEISLLATHVPQANPLTAIASAAPSMTSPEADALVDIYWFCQSRLMSQLAFAVDYARFIMQLDSTRAHTAQVLV